MKTNRWALASWAVLLLLFLAGASSADTSTVLTSTADFDAGTYSVSGGNRDINSNSCNLGITAGQVELDSLKGDSFCIADADADTFKWTSGNVRSPVSPQKEILSGILRQSVTDSGPESVPAVETSSDATFSGDFDLRLKIDENTCTILGNCVTRITISNEKLSNQEYSDSGTVDGVLYQNGAGTLSFFTITNGGVSAVGSGTAVPSDPVWFRITRATNTWTAYYSTDGAAYTQDEQGTNTVAGGLYLQIYTQVSGIAVTHIVDYDDFHLQSGTIDAGGFRSSGSWASAGQTPTTELFRFLNVTYSGASATTYITAVSLINGAGSYQYVDNTDRTTGTSQSYVVPDLQILGAWKVQVNLTGNGAGTVTLASVTVFSSPVFVPPCGFEDALPGFAGIIAIVVGIGILGAALALLDRADQLTPANGVALMVGIIAVIILSVALLSPFPCGG